MRKLLIIIFLLLGQHVLRAQNELERALLWRISGNGLTKNSYLFGTIHAICAESYFFSQAAQKALEESERLVLELDMDDPLMLLQVQQAMMMPEGKHLRDLLPEADYKRLHRFFKDSLNMDLNILGYMKPISLSSLLYPKMMSCPTVSYEFKLMETAKKQQKEIVGMETVADQLKVFDAIPIEKQAAMLLEMSEKYGQHTGEMQELMAAYRSQDINALYELIKKSSFGTEDFEQVLLTDRNRSWIDKIANMSQEKATFFAVGAGHLGGTEGVIALLRNKGFTLEPIP